MNDIRHWLWLSLINDIGPIRAKALLERFGSPEAIWNASEKQLKTVDGIGENYAKSIISSKDRIEIEKELYKINRYQTNIVTLFSECYPEHLKNIYSPPVLLFVKGNLSSADSISVSIVGSRNATQYGIRVAYDLGKQLAQKGITVVSGMARGIDTAAHKGALDGGGRTIAVLGCGLDFVYPPENKVLMNNISNNGAVITEYPLGTKPDAKNFPCRNRIISGFSLGTIIVEASSRSGSLITADLALEQNREVFAVPGPIYSKASEGTNNLIKQGAKIVTSLVDILEELNIELVNNNCIEQFKQVEYNDLSNEENTIINKISNIPVHLENIMKQTGYAIGKVNSILTMLELKGLIRQLPGRQFIRV